MRRAFLSLYGLIVISVIAIGWGLDRLWNNYFANTAAPSTQQELVVTMAGILDQQDTDFQAKMDLIAKPGSTQIKVFPIGSFAQSNLLAQIQQGRPVEVHQQRDTLTIYQLLPRRQSVLRLEISQPEAGDPFFYDLMLVVFYGSLALVVFLWMWPLSRDLAKLEKQTRILGKAPLPASLHIGPASAIYDLADAFQRMSERIQELLATHKEMTYAVSHELRTPLARMKFALEIAATHQEPQKILEKLDSVRQDVTEMDALVSQLLAYAGFEQGEQTMDFQQGDLQAMVEHLLERMQSDKSKKPIEVAVSSKLTGAVRCEWCLMERAILNLLLNACRFAQRQVIVKLIQDDYFNHVVVVDDGPGIAIEDRQRVLSSFVRLTNHTNSQERGFGLGLAIVQRVMTWHQGVIEISDSELGGTAVELRWPRNL